ncbi:MAG: hypothetical protein ACRD0K_30505 [Egibacteraceae bacterium]
MAENIWEYARRTREEKAGERAAKDAGLSVAKPIPERVAPAGSIEEKILREAEEKKKRPPPR